MKTPWAFLPLVHFLHCLLYLDRLLGLHLTTSPTENLSILEVLDLSAPWSLMLS